EVLAQLRGRVAHRLELGAVDQLAADQRLATHAVQAGRGVDGEAGVLAILAHLEPRAAELAVTATELAAHRVDLAVETLAMLQVFARQARLREHRDDAAVAAAIQLVAHRARFVDALDQLLELVAGDRLAVR